MSVPMFTVHELLTNPNTDLGDSTRVTDHSTYPWGWCERPRVERVNPLTGVVEQDRCNTNRCRGCIVRRAYKVRLAIEAAAPTHLVTLTIAGSSWRAANKRWAALSRKLRRSNDFDAAYVVEVGVAGDQLHLHLLWRGDVPSALVLSEAAQSVGLGRNFDVREVHDLRGMATYLTKQVHDGRGALHLEVNGGRLVHATRGFWTLNGSVVAGGWVEVAKRLNRGGTDVDPDALQVAS